MERRAVIALLTGGVASLFLGWFSDTKPANKMVRPPGALGESEFLATCLRCGKCAQVCPRNAIIIGRGDKGVSIGTPYIIPRRAACDMCLECIPACSSGALRAVEKDQVRMGLAEIDRTRCVAWQGDECKVCYTSCPFYNKGIILEDHKRPVVDSTVCTGCGICEHVCIIEPAAISVQARR